METPLAAETVRQNRRRTISGVVLSDKMQKTIVVQTTYRRSHPVYGKVMTHRVKFKVHDPQQKAKVGDLVVIRECRTISREKRWVLISVTGKAKEPPRQKETSDGPNENAV